MYPYPVPITNFNEPIKPIKTLKLKMGAIIRKNLMKLLIQPTKTCMSMSVSNRIAPTSADFLVAIVSIKYFIIAKNSTRVMGGLIALFYWNETINRKMNLATEEEMTHKIKSVFDQLLW
jgi:hypothetical protein